jgi:hypothetical protein
MFRRPTRCGISAAFPCSTSDSVSFKRLGELPEGAKHDAGYQLACALIDDMKAKHAP